MGTTPVATWNGPNYTTQDPVTYKNSLDACFTVAKRFATAFAPHAQSSPNMTVRLDAGFIFAGTTLTEVAAQSTGTITAPVGNPRIDRVVIDASTGAVSVITGTPAASPAAPAITSGKLPVAQVLVQTSSTAITNSMITDERAIAQGTMALQNASAVAITGGTINGATVGATTPASGAFTTLSATGLVDLSAAGAGQIKFPATQNASSNANTLDDYEEGTWTPGVSFGGGTTGITYTAQNGIYTKIGRHVFLNMRIILTSKGSSSGNAKITGLPFTPSSDNALQWLGELQGWSNVSVATIRVLLYKAGDTTTDLYDMTAATTGIGGTQWDNTDFTNSTGLQADMSFPV